MRRLALASSVVALLACTLGPLDTDRDETDADTGICENSIVGWPHPNTTDVDYRASIEVRFAIVDPTATIAVEGVPGTQAWRDANTLVFTPSEKLAPDTDYQVTVSFCAVATYTIRTGPTGPAVDPAVLVGRAYAFDISEGRFLAPEGVATLLQTYLVTDMVLGVVTADATTVQLVGGAGTAENRQDTCRPTQDLPLADFAENPYFAIGATPATIRVAGIPLDVTDFTMAGAFRPDASGITGMVVTGLIDTRALVPLLDDEEAGDDGVCKLLDSIDIACEPCPTGGETCLSVAIDLLTAVASDVPVVAIPTQEEACLRAECSGDPACPD